MVGAWVADSASEHRFPTMVFWSIIQVLEVRPVIPCIEVRVYIERDADASVPNTDEAGLARSRQLMRELRSRLTEIYPERSVIPDFKKADQL